MTNKNAETHAKFLKFLEDSAQAVELVAKRYFMKGYDVFITSGTKAAAPEDWREHVDGGDLYVRGTDSKPQRIEVKHLTAEFTCREDWPFGNEFIICAKHSYDMALPKPHAYFILSKDREYAGVVLNKTRDKWFVKNIKDSRTGVPQDFYIINPDHVRFVKL